MCLKNFNGLEMFGLFCSSLQTACRIRSALRRVLPIRCSISAAAGDVYQTNADTTKLEIECDCKPHWSLHDGIAEFMKWYKSDKNPLR